MNQTHVPLPNSRRPAPADATRVRDPDPQREMEVTLDLRGPAWPDAENVPEHGLSSDEFNARYSSSAADAETVTRVLAGYGLKVEGISLPTHSMRVSGSVAAMEAAFQPHFGIYHSAAQGEFRDREGDIQIPAELAGIVTNVLGLGERQAARRAAAAQPAAPAAFAPADFEQRYQFPPGDGQGQQIAIAEFGGGYFPSDLQAFCAKYGLPVPVVQTTSVGLPVLTLDQIKHLSPARRKVQLGETVEVMMDVEVIAGLCPHAQITVYYAPFTQKGWTEDDAQTWSPAALISINARLAAAATRGITVCVSSGDDGSGDQVADGRAHVNFPASSPFVLSVGGTMVSGGVEQTWWEAPGQRTPQGGGSTGGGVSVVFQRPQWQTVQVKSLNQRRHQCGRALVGGPDHAPERGAAGRQPAALPDPAPVPERCQRTARGASVQRHRRGRQRLESAARRRVPRRGGVRRGHGRGYAERRRAAQGVVVTAR